MWNDRESVEWINGWIEEAQHPEKRRWLLVGDSVARQYRSSLQAICSIHGIIVDVYATSFQVEDPALEGELRHFLSRREYVYEFILVSIGPHHGLERRTCESRVVHASYRQSYERLLFLLSKHCLRLVLVSATPLATPGNLTVPDGFQNNEVQSRNRIAKTFAERYGLPFLDHYGLVQRKKEQFIYKDKFHFSSKREQELLSRYLWDGMVRSGAITSDGMLPYSLFCKNRHLSKGAQNCYRVRANNYWRRVYESASVESEWLRPDSEDTGDYFVRLSLFLLLDSARFSRILVVGASDTHLMVLEYARYFGVECSLAVREYHDLSYCEELPRKTEICEVPELWERRMECPFFHEKTYDLVVIECPRGGTR